MGSRADALLLRAAHAGDECRTALCRWLATGLGAFLVALAMLLALADAAAAKTPGTTHCYGKTCHRVSTLEEMDGSVGRTGVLKASFYDDCKSDRFNACGLTSSGALFRPDRADNAASPIFPDGTVILAYNPENNRAAVLRVNSAGPYWGDRKLDVSRAAADKLGFRHKGVAELMVAIVKSPDMEEARYKKMREYGPVPGYIGVFPSFRAAHSAALARLELELASEPMKVDDAGRALSTRPRIDPHELFQHAIVYVDAAEPSAVAASVPVTDVSPTPLPGGREVTVAQRPPLVVVTQAAAPPPVAIAVFEPDFSLEGLRQRFMAFVAAARHQARATAPPLTLPPPDVWSEKLVRFVWRARQQARASATRSGPLYNIFAELRLKAQYGR